LIELEDFSFDTKETKDIPRPAMIEILDLGQLFCRAKIVAFHEEK
jgi:hypothetical protein